MKKEINIDGILYERSEAPFKDLSYLLPDYKQIDGEWYKKKETSSYTIISFRFSDDHIATLQEDGRYKQGPRNFFSLNSMLHEGSICVDSGRVYIHSVRRESDQMVFTVGDETIYGIVSSFKITNNSIDVVHSYKELAMSYYKYTNKTFTTDINNISEVPKKEYLFTSVDGVPIHVGDHCYAVDKEKCSVDKWHRSWASKLSYREGSGVKNVLLFSTRDAAEAYVDLNKKQYSKQDVLDAIKYAFDQSNTFMIDPFNLKSKLKI